MIIDIQEIKRLVNEGLVSEKTFSDYPELRMYKYKNKVFYKNLWDTSDMLTECRGLVLDTSGNIVALPFQKVFNYKENGTTIRDSAVVKYVEKKNGFFAACSLYNGEVLVSTTGSLDSEFTQKAKDMINLDIAEIGLLGMKETLGMSGTMMFEICHPDDPHIVEEDIGAYLIGFRAHNSGMLAPEEVLDRLAYACNVEALSKATTVDAGEEVFKRPKHSYGSFKSVRNKLKECRHEGYMVYQKGSDKKLKLKSPHYLTKKFLMRMSDKKVEDMFDNLEIFKQNIDEEFYGVSEHIVKTQWRDQWRLMTDQDRREVIENYFGG